MAFKKIKTMGVVQFRNTIVGDTPVRGTNAAYIAFCYNFAENVTILDASDSHVHTHVDAIMGPGGEDVDTLLYDPRHAPHINQGRANPHYTWWIKNMWPRYERRGIPFLGICMNFQAMGAIKGCKLEQHVVIPHSKPRAELIDTLLGANGDAFAEGLADKQVNSIHHQAIYPEGVNEQEFEIVAISKEYGNVEIMKGRNYPSLLCQFHPEEMNCKLTVSMFQNLLTTHAKVQKEVVPF